MCAIVAYGAVILAFPAGSQLLLLIDNLGSTIAALTGGLLAFLAARRHTAGRARCSWQLLGLALAAWAFGDGYWSWSEIIVGVIPDVPSWADIGYLSMIALIIAGAVTQPIVRRRDISRLRLLVDILILLSALVAVAWSVTLGPLFQRLQTEPLTQAVTRLYPLGSLTALFLLIALLRQATDAPQTTRLLTGGLALTAAADVAYVLLAASESYTTLTALPAGAIISGGRRPMKITDLSITLHTWDVPPVNYTGTKAGGRKEVGVVTIMTDEGVEGHSFLGTSSQGADEFLHEVIGRLKPLVIGRDPLDIGAIWQAMWARNRLASMRSICSVDVALWDIAGKVAGLPLHRLLGTYRDKAPAYASSAVMDSPQEYAEEALSFRERGWQAYKIHPPRRWKDDIAVCEAVKQAVGDTMVLMLDSTWSYGYEEALRVGLAIQEMGYYWYEDPLAEDDLYNYVKLKSKLDIPILATEHSPGGMFGYTPWITEQATDMLRGDVAVKGGITPMVKICHLAEAFRMKCEIHHGGNSLNNVANLHITMAVPNCEYFEVLLPDSAQKYGLVNDITVDAQGFVHAPTGPGLGYEIDWELVKRNQTRVVR